MVFVVSIDGAAINHAKQLPNQPPYIQDAAYNAAASDSRTKATSLRAHAAAARAKTALLRTEEVELGEEARMVELQGAYNTASVKASNTALYAQSATRSFQATKSIADAAPAQAKQMAILKVQDMLSQAHSDLNDWRNKVLIDPDKEAYSKAAKAAKPYYDMANVFYSRMNDYMGKSAGLTGGFAGSSTDMLPADISSPEVVANELLKEQSLQQAGVEWSTDPTIVQDGANSMKDIIPMYMAAGQQAAYGAHYSTNFDSLPSAPLDPNFAFTPPPPAR